MTELNTENNTVEVSDMEDTETSNTTPLEESTEPVEDELNQEIEISEPEQYICPWANAPENTIYYNKIYEDGHLGSSTESAEMAYIFGWFNNRVSKDDVEVSDVNGFIYLKDKCPHKTQEQLARDEAKIRIAELKKYLSDTDYKAIKFAEGALTIVEYESDRVARANARREINELEGLLS